MEEKSTFTYRIYLKDNKIKQRLNNVCVIIVNDL